MDLIKEPKKIFVETPLKAVKNFLQLLKKMKNYTKVLFISKGSTIIVLVDNFYFYKQLNISFENDLYINNIKVLNKSVKNLDLNNIEFKIDSSALYLEDKLKEKCFLEMPIGDINNYPRSINLNDEIYRMEVDMKIADFELTEEEFKNILKGLIRTGKKSVVSISGNKNDTFLTLRKDVYETRIKSSVLNCNFSYCFNLKKSFFHLFSPTLKFSIIKSRHSEDFAYLKLEQPECIHLFSSILK